MASALDVLTDDVRAMAHGGPSAGPLNPGPMSAGRAAQEIERLAALHAAGHLTRAELASLTAAFISQV